MNNLVGQQVSRDFPACVRDDVCVVFLMSPVLSCPRFEAGYAWTPFLFLWGMLLLRVIIMWASIVFFGLICARALRRPLFPASWSQWDARTRWSFLRVSAYHLAGQSAVASSLVAYLAFSSLGVVRKGVQLIHVGVASGSVPLAGRGFALMAAYVLMEEIVKRRGGLWAVIFFESYFHDPAVVPHVVNIAMRVVGHCAWTWMPLHCGWLAHFVWNAGTLLFLSDFTMLFMLPVMVTNVTGAIPLAEEVVEQQARRELLLIPPPAYDADDDEATQHSVDAMSDEDLLCEVTRHVGLVCLDDYLADRRDRARPISPSASLSAPPRLRRSRATASAQLLAARKRATEAVRSKADLYGRQRGWSHARVMASLSEAERCALRAGHQLSLRACERVIAGRAHAMLGLASRPAPLPGSFTVAPDGHELLTDADLEFHVLCYVREFSRRDMLRKLWVLRDAGCWDASLMEVWRLNLPRSCHRVYSFYDMRLTTDRERWIHWRTAQVEEAQWGQKCCTGWHDCGMGVPIASYDRDAVHRFMEARPPPLSAEPGFDQRQSGEWITQFLAFLNEQFVSWESVSQFLSVTQVFAVPDSPVATLMEAYRALERSLVNTKASVSETWQHAWHAARNYSFSPGEWRQWPVLVHLFRFLSCLSIFGLNAVCKFGFDATSLLGWAGAFETMIRRDSAPTVVVGHLINAMSTFVGMVLEWWRGGDVSLLHRLSSARDLIERYEFLLHDPLSKRTFGRSAALEAEWDRELRRGRASRIPTCYVRPLLPPEMVSELLRVDELARRVLKYNPDAAEAVLLRKLMLEASSYRHRIEQEECAGSQRVQGLGFIVLGPGGVGKTTWAQETLKAIGRKCGLPTADVNILPYDATSNFQDGFNTQQWAFMMDDPELQVMSPPTAGARFYAADYVSFLNVNTRGVEAADVESKGTQWADFVTGCIVSNVWPSFDRMLQDPYPFYRRTAFVVEVRARPEFATAGGMLDPAKMAASGSNDYCEYIVRPFDDSRYVPTQGFTQHPYQQGVVLSAAEACRYISDVISQHYHAGRNRMLAVKSSQRYCSECGMTAAMHGPQPCDDGLWKEDYEDGTKMSIELPKGTMVHANSGLARPVVAQPVNVPAAKKTDARPPVVVQVNLNGRAVKQSADPVAVAAFFVVMACTAAIMLAAWLWLRLHEVASSQRVVSLAAAVDRVAAVATTERVQAATSTVDRINAAASAAGCVGDTFVDSVQWCRDRLAEHEAQLKMLLVALGALAAALAARAVLRGSDVKHDEKQVFEWRPTAQGDVSKWDRVESSYFMPSHEMRSHTMDAARDRLWANMGVIVVDGRQQHFIRVSGNFIVTTLHLFFKDRQWVNAPARLYLRSPHGTMLSDPVSVQPQFGVNCVAVGDRDLIVLRVDSLPTCDTSLLPLMADVSSYKRVGVVDDSWFVRGTKVTPVRAHAMVYERVSNWAYEGAETTIGECGYPLLVKYDKAVILAGLHSTRLWDKNLGALGSTSLAEELVRPEIQSAIDRLKGERVAMQVTYSERMIDLEGRDVVFQAFPAKSSFAAAMALRAKTGAGATSAFFPLGNLVNPRPLGTFSSSLHDSLLRPFCAALEDQFWPTGKRIAAPVFKGRVLPDVPGATTPLWTDPYVDNLLAFNTASSCRPDLLKMAVDDYLHGLPDNLPRYKPYNLYEAIVGAGGFDGLNKKTSAGQPFGGPKGNWFSVDHASKSVGLDPTLLDQLNFMLSEAGCGRAVMCVFTHVPKDEGTAKPNPRIFNVGPMALLLMTRMFVWPVFEALRGCRRFSECSIGLNLLGEEGVREFVQMFAGSKAEALLKQFTDGDFANFDIKNIADFLQATRDIVCAIARKMGASDQQVLVIDCVLLSTIQTIRFLKNDLFMVIGTTPSGVLITGELNSLVNSLIARCAYYWRAAVMRCDAKWSDLELVLTRDHLRNVPWFRDVVVYQSTGDDNIGRTQTEYFDMAAMSEFCSLVGMVYTRADKRPFGPDAPTKQAFTECSYLKRSFRFDEEYGQWKAALEEKSMVKMMLMRKPGLTAPDHAATLATNVCREAFYHGRDVFERYVQFTSDALQKLQLSHNIFYNVRSYEYYQSAFEQGTLKTWGPDAVEVFSMDQYLAHLEAMG